MKDTITLCMSQQIQPRFGKERFGKASISRSCSTSRLMRFRSYTALAQLLMQIIRDMP